METFRENLIKKLGPSGLEKVEGARIGIAGAGGLGSNLALNLVRAGFKKLTIVDFDVVAPSNLDRQFYFLDQVGMKKVEALSGNLLKVNPGLEIRAFNSRIEQSNVKQLFADCDCLAECLDLAEYKSMLVSSFAGQGILVVAVSGLGGVGSSDDIKIHRKRDDLILIGDLRSDIAQRPALSPRVNVAAAKQADIILEYVLRR